MANKGEVVWVFGPKVFRNGHIIQLTHCVFLHIDHVIQRIAGLQRIVTYLYRHIYIDNSRQMDAQNKHESVNGVESRVARLRELFVHRSTLLIFGGPIRSTEDLEEDYCIAIGIHEAAKLCNEIPSQWPVRLSGRTSEADASLSLANGMP